MALISVPAQEEQEPRRDRTRLCVHHREAPPDIGADWYGDVPGISFGNISAKAAAHKAIVPRTTSENRIVRSNRVVG
jgi:hypothetical protein